jgi:hypothetical protein
MTTAEVLDALTRRHSLPEWLTYRECWRIDLLAWRCWGTVHHRRIGYEVKVSRGDFLAEARKPDKQVRALELTHQSFFACPAGLIQREELPEGWGLVWVDERGRCRVVVGAPVREARPFTEDEVIYLARFPYYREGIEAERREHARMRQRCKQLEAALTRGEIATSLSL